MGAHLEQLELPTSVCVCLSGPLDRAFVSCYSTTDAFQVTDLWGFKIRGSREEGTYIGLKQPRTNEEHYRIIRHPRFSNLFFSAKTSENWEHWAKLHSRESWKSRKRLTPLSKPHLSLELLRCRHSYFTYDSGTFYLPLTFCWHKKFEYVSIGFLLLVCQVSTCTNRIAYLYD